MTGLLPNTSYYVRAYAINSQGTVYGTQVSFTTRPVLSLATVTTNTPTNVSAISAVLGGNVTSDGNATVAERGICYSATKTPTTTDNKIAMGSGMGTFSNTVTGLTANTLYYVRAYAINSQGTSYGEQVIFSTLALTLATVTTSTASSISTNSAMLGGNVTSDGNATVTERGICYSLTQNPTTANNKVVMGSGTGSFSNTVTSLTANTPYYVRAYAINSQGTAYGAQVSFTTAPAAALATVTTTPADSIGTTSAFLGGNVTSDGNTTVAERGICYSLTQNPTTANNKVVMGSGTGSFSNTVTSLTANTPYYVRAYAINSQGTAYGAQVSFTTAPAAALATVTTTPADSIGTTSAFLGGNVTSDGNTTVTERGICYSTTQNPTTANNKVAMGNGTGSFSNTVTGLTANTPYYVKAYAINSQGTAYGSQFSFTTNPVPLTATVITSDITQYTFNTATVGGNVTSAGSSSVTERGIVYGTSANPTLSNNKIVKGNELGSFIETISNLSSNTTYYVRAYAINAVGTSYGNEVSFILYMNVPGPSVADVDGYTYKTVKIGSQIWMAENLKTTKYRNGESIPIYLRSQPWWELTTGAYYNYLDMPTNSITFGKLYNWYAVADTRGICPFGWHASTDAEWQILADYLGGINVAGGKLKDSGTTYWNSPNTGGTNISGFTALPAGARASYGDVHVGANGSWWTAPIPNTYTYWVRTINYAEIGLNRFSDISSSGFSVRCVKD